MLRTIALISLLATPLAAQDKETLCSVTGEIVDAGVAERLGGADEQTAIDAVIESLPDDQANFKPAVEPLVKWIYTLDADQLAQEVGKSYVLACLSN